MSKSLLSVLFTLSFILSPTVIAYDLENSDTVYLQMLLQENPEAHKMGLRAVYKTPNISNIVFDLIAEQLAHADNSTLNIDTHAWYIKALGQSKSDRYSSIIDKSLKGREHPKLAKQLQQARSAITTTSPTQYQSGKLNIETLKQDIKAKIKTSRANKPLHSIGLFHLERCSPLEDILNTFGAPDSMGSFDIDSQPIKFSTQLSVTFFVPNNHLQLNYYDFATIVVDRDRQTNNWCLFNYATVDIEHQLIPTDDSELQAFRTLAWTHDHDSLAKAAKLARKKYKGQQAYLDELALRLWWGKFEKNSYIQAGLTHITKTLIKTKDPRYWTAINNINNSTISKTIRAFTPKYLKTVEKGNTEQFDPSMLVQKNHH